MNPVGELLRVEDIYLDLDVSDESQLLRRIAELLSRRYGLSDVQVLHSLVEREQLGSTGLGHGVAIPHARMPQCYAETGVFVRTRIAIPFDAPDRKPVSLFLGLIVPRQAAERHLRLLATAATMFSDATFRGTLRTCPDPRSVLDLLAAWSDSQTLVNHSADATPGSPVRGDPGG
jgi:PTS system nitrogen regulatory IIA component